MNEWDMIDVTELKDGCRYQINAKTFLKGGDPKVLKLLALGGLECDPERTSTPSYSTAKYSELERSKLYGRVGGNPRRRKK